MPDPVRVLIVCSLIPYPADGGEAVRGLGLLVPIARELRAVGWVGRVVAVERPNTTAQDIKAMEALLAYPLEVFPQRALLGNNGLARALRWGLSAFTGLPAWIPARTPRTLSVSIERERADVVVFLGEAAARYYRAQGGPSPLLVWDKSNVIGASAAETWGGRFFRSRIAARSAVRYERTRVNTFDRIVVTSGLEAEKLVHLYGRMPDLIIPSGVNTISSLPAEPRPKVLGWLGSFSYTANTDALERFLLEEWGRIAAEGWLLELAGSGTPPPSLMKAIATAPGVNRLGFVQELDQWLVTLTAGVVPLNTGAGVKLKTLSMMAAGVPVVGTACAFEGIRVTDAVSGFIAERGKFAEALHRLDQLTAPERANVGQRGRSLVAEDFLNSALSLTYAAQLQSWFSEHSGTDRGQ